MTRSVSTWARCGFWSRWGVLIKEPEARVLLEAHGAQVNDELVRILEGMVRQAVAAAPPRFTVHSRDPARSLHIEPNRVHYGPGPTCPNFLDPYTAETRPYVMADAVAVARTCDALEHIDFVESLGSISDAPGGLMDVFEFALMAQHTVKPIVAWAFTRESCATIHQMAVAMAGGEAAFRARPNYIFYAEPMSPLHSGQDAVRKLMYCAENRIPIVYTPCPIAGATSPVSGAGTLAVALAETLSGVVMAQQKAPGAPIIAGGVVSIMDMGAMIYSYGAPELALFSAALTDVVKHLGLPMFSTAGCSDAKVVDQQAAIEATLSILFAALSGANLSHDVGFLESALIGSNEMVALSDEVIGMAKQVVKGIAVDDEHLALDTIAQVGPAGGYISSEHTLRHFREFWHPTTMTRCAMEKWEAMGRPTMGQRVRERVDSILTSHQPLPIAPDQMAELRRIVAAADEQYGQE